MLVTVKYVLFFIWIAYLLATSLYMFARGFLKNRQLLNSHSSCDVDNLMYVNELLQQKPSLSKTDPVLLNSQLNGIRFCRRSKHRVILMLVDGLRHDFITRSLTQDHYYLNQMPVVSELYLKYPNSTRIFKFLADPPTTTMQRINGITTGSLPTFIDVGSNFASQRISEDNVIDQVVGEKKRIVFMGDDTWVNLFPDKFHRSFPFPSFNVWDLDTVDNGVKKHLFSEVKKTDWELLIAHFLGVDHCGHRYGPDHPEMKRKLGEMNEVIGRLVDDMDNQTILMVFGDHGMTETGDHGGETDREITAGLFVHSKFPLIVDNSDEDSVQQIDLAPTLSTILGVAIPFANLGTLTPSLLPASATPDDTGLLPRLALWSNVKQVTKFMADYSNSNEQFTSAQIKQLLHDYERLSVRYLNAVTNIELTSAMSDARSYLTSARNLCRRVWVQFDSTAMSRGLILFSFVSMMTYMFVDGLSGDHFEDLIVKGNFLLFVFITIELAIGLGLVLFEIGWVSDRLLTVLFSTDVASVLILAASITVNWPLIVDNWYTKEESSSALNPFCRVFMLLLCLGLFSNSYIVDESFVLSFLLVSSLWLSMFYTSVDGLKRLPKKLIDYVSFCFRSLRGQTLFLAVVGSFLGRLSWVYWQCREEQSNWCSSAKPSATSSRCVFTIVMLSVWVTAIRSTLRSLGNLSGLSPTVLITSYVPVISLVCSGGFWILKSTPPGLQSNLFIPWQMYIFSRVIFMLCLSSLCYLVYSPLSIHYILSRKQLSLGRGSVPQIFQTLKSVLQNSDQEGEENPVVYGLATSYSAAFLNLALLCSLLGAMLLGESRALSVIVMVLSMTVLGLQLTVWRHSQAKSVEDLFTVPWWAALCWTISSHHHFYGTGHQATFLNLQWDSAILFGDITSTLVPGALVLTNTFFSQMLHALLLPMLLVLPFSIDIIWPHTVYLQEVKKGELLLFQNSTLRRQGFFSLLIKYLLVNAARVFVTMLSATIHARHLMVWKIFAPKLIFEGISFLVTIPCLLIGYLIVERVSAQIEAFIQMLEAESPDKPE